ncbi:MAG: hypothetical protein KBE27_07180 [Syntrophorhabdaceae bacterium]|nr:hypothetical protein [Syntrophorhabdales bacterium]MBP9561582.1 hypothetical protein [Syntrophorhabdaceae bacterium]
MTREEILKKDGWEKRFVASEPRLSEMSELYREIGFEVLLEPLQAKEELKDDTCCEKGCTVCLDADRERYKVIYTRPLNP